MGDLQIIIAALVIAGAVILVLRHRVDIVLWVAERVMLMVAIAMVFFIMLFVTGEIGGRYLFNSPIPGHLELSELFMPAIVFLSYAYTQSTDGHIRLTLIIEHLPPSVRRWLDVATHVVAVLVLSMLTFYAGRSGFGKFTGGDVTMSPPYFEQWPSAMSVSFGLAVATLRFYVELLDALLPGLRIIRHEQRESLSFGE